METVRIYPLRGLTKEERQRLRNAQMEAARVWMYCVQRHQQTRQAHLPWPRRKQLQEETKGGQYALHSQSIQMVTHQFLANVETIAQLRKTDKRHRYPYHPKRYMTVEWPEQAISRHGNTLLLPMRRGCPSLTFHLEGLPETIGAVSLVWNGGYELHMVVSAAATIEACPIEKSAGHATIDLGEIHLAAVTTTTGKGLIVTGREIRSLKRQHTMTLREIQQKLNRCQKGSRRSRRLGYARERARGQAKQRIRDLRHKATWQVVQFCQQEGVQTVYVGNLDGVRKRNRGRHHNQRMARWEYGKDRAYLQHKSQQAHMTCFTGSERGTSSTCPSCGKHTKPRGRVFACRHCGFVGHRDIVGSMNMHPIAFGSRIVYPRSLTYRRPGPARVRRRDEQPAPVARAGTS
jgi:putative transposase